MSFSRYPAYKKSGIEWLAEVPKHWETRRIKRLFDIKKRIAGVDGLDILSITQRGIRVKDTESNDGQISLDYTKYQIVEVGDFAMNGMDLLTGYVDISRRFGVTSPDYRVFSIKRQAECFNRYYLYLFQMGYKNKIFYAFGQGSSQLGRWRFPTDQFNDFVFPHPPISEQIQIASFLDREIGKIDALVEEQKRLIELLKEKRQAVISHAVTKGLDLNASMKDSGVEWLGEVPAHWKKRRLKHAMVSFEQGWSPQCEAFSVETDDEWAVLKVGCVNGGLFNPFENKALPTDLEPISELSIRADDLLISRANTRDLVGSAAVAVRDHRNLLLCDKLYRGRTKVDECLPSFVARYLSSNFVRGQIELAANGASSSMLNIGQSVILNMPVFCSPITEQSAIITYLDYETSNFDDLIHEAESAIQLLQERRSALISAAVTGKIDVRSLAEEAVYNVAAQ